MKSNVLISGDIGTGKTRSLITLLPEYLDEHGATHRGAGLEVFLLSLEPGGDASVERNVCGAPGLAPGQGIHIHYIPPVEVDWITAKKFAELTNLMSVDAVLKSADPAKSKYRTFLQVYETFSDFTCDRCGECFGAIDTWDEFDKDELQLAGPQRRVICIDSLTGLTKAALQCCIGGRPAYTWPEINLVQGNIENMLSLFWGATKCSAILIAHIDREKSPITGIESLTVHTLGQKLAPRIVKMPDEVILAEHSMGKYTWSTVAQGVVLKHRRLPESGDLVPDFAQLFK